MRCVHLMWSEDHKASRHSFLKIDCVVAMKEAYLELTGEGWKTRTSMPRCLVSMAKLAPKEDRKLLVAAYRTLKGEGMAAAADDVYTKQPLSFLAVCRKPHMMMELSTDAFL